MSKLLPLILLFGTVYARAADPVVADPIPQLPLASANAAATDREQPAPADAGPSQMPAVTPAPARKTVQHDGQTFELANSTAAGNVETDEYVVDGEKIADWSQLVTVQRLTLGQPTPSDEFLAYFQKRLETESGARLEILQQAKPATVFTVRFPKSERNDEQMMVCLAFLEPAKPNLLNIVQYALKPSRVSASLAEMRLKSWRDKFLTQAKALKRDS